MHIKGTQNAGLLHYITQPFNVLYVILYKNKVNILLNFKMLLTILIIGPQL